MHQRSSATEMVDPKWTEDQADEREECHLLHTPQRRAVGGVEQVLRGKIPGTPG